SEFLHGAERSFNQSVDNHRLASNINQMVEHRAVPLDSVFHALADPTRRAMIQRLAQRERTVGELCEPFAMSLAGGSKHIKVLEGAGLVERRVAGRTHYCKLRASHLADAHRWLAHFERYWNTQLDAL